MTTMRIARLHELLRLDEGSGKLYWLVATNHRIRVGDEAGSVNPKGYRQVKVDRKLHQAHRIVFAMTHGRWPEAQIDHINGAKDDNRPSNLREATNAQNCANQGLRATNKSGVKGVSWYPRGQQWKASIRAGGHPIHLGYFDDLETAGYAYLSASLKHHGEFARVAA